MDETLPVAGTAVVLRDRAEGMQTLMLRRPDHGSFPGAWVFPGGRVDPGDVGDDEQGRARSAALRETEEEAGIRVSDLRVLSCWEPPAEAPKRIRTWFFLAREDGDEIVTSEGEIEEAAWLTVADAFSRHESGGFTLFPPTWVTLDGLRRFRTVDEALDAAGDAAVFRTRVQRVEGGQWFLWEGDEEYPDRPGAPGARHRLTAGAVPWRYERT